MLLDFLSKNEQTKFPFNDDSYMLSSNGKLLTNDVIADLLIVFKSEHARKAILTNIAKIGSVVTFTFAIKDEQNNSLATLNVTQDLAALTQKHSLISMANSDYAVKLVTGSGFISWCESLTVNETYNCEVVPLAVMLHSPRVRSIAFYNLTELEAIVSGDELTETNLELSAGNNIEFAKSTTAIQCSVIPGAGTGLYNPCNNELTIKSINHIPGDLQYQNFALNADGCYVLTRGFQNELLIWEDTGLTIENVCTPKCTAEQLGAFAHYLNRVKDGMEDLVAYINSVYLDLEAYINNYKTVILPQLQAPVVKSTLTRFDNGYGTIYTSVVIGFFNRSDQGDINVTATVTGGQVVRAFYRKGTTTTPIVGNTLSTRVLPCLSYSRFEIVLKTAGPITIAATAGTTTYNKVHS